MYSLYVFKLDYITYVFTPHPCILCTFIARFYHYAPLQYHAFNFNRIYVCRVAQTIDGSKFSPEQVLTSPPSCILCKPVS